MANTSTRWDALDVFRGLTIMLMLLNLSPGSWEYNYAFLVHARWEGGTLIDMVAPAFLFCIGVAMPLSFARRAAKGASRSDRTNFYLAVVARSIEPFDMSDHFAFALNNGCVRLDGVTNTRSLSGCR